jgi:hypothetical protein
MLGMRIDPNVSGTMRIGSRQYNMMGIVITVDGITINMRQLVHIQDRNATIISIGYFEYSETLEELFTMFSRL